MAAVLLRRRQGGITAPKAKKPGDLGEEKRYGRPEKRDGRTKERESRMNNRRNLIELKTPAGWENDKSKESLPAGNGKTGILVQGGVRTEEITFNRFDLWRNTIRRELPDVSDTLSKVREAIDRGDYASGNRAACDALKASGFDGCVGEPFPLGQLWMDFPCDQPFSHYRRTLQMDTGEITVRYNLGETIFERRCFVSRCRDMLVMRLTASRPAITGRMTLRLYPMTRFTPEHMQPFVDGLEARAVREARQDDHLLMASANDNGEDFGMAARLIGCHCRAADGMIELEGADDCLLLIKAFSRGSRHTDLPRVLAELDAMEDDYETLLAEHAAVHGELLGRTQLELYGGEDYRSVEELLLDAYEDKAPAVLLEKLWRFGRYLFVSGSAEDGWAFPLYGLWYAGYALPWSQHVANENVEMIYWHACVGGFAGLVKPLIDYYASLTADFRENARKLFGCRGICVTAYTSPGMGLSTVNVPVIVNWISAAGWLSRHFVEYCCYTGDEETLRQKVLPFMRETALFYQDFAVLDEQGRVKLYPSVSPENTPKNFIPPHFADHMGHILPTVMNATMDFAVMKELLSSLLELSGRYGVYEDERPAWQELLDRIPAYMVNADGAIKEWMHPALEDHYHHRHLSHLYPVFPGDEVGLRDPRLPAFARAVDLRELGGQSGWSLTHMANIYARLGRGEAALQCLDSLTRTCLTTSLMTVHNDWRQMGMSLETPEQDIVRQLDANMGFVSAIQEMLLRVHPDYLQLLPACPARLSAGRVRRMHFAGGTVSFDWDLTAGMLCGEIEAQRDIALEIRLPAFCGEAAVRGAGGMEQTVKGSFVCRLHAGESLSFSAL